MSAHVLGFFFFKKFNDQLILFVPLFSYVNTLSMTLYADDSVFLFLQVQYATAPANELRNILTLLHQVLVSDTVE